MFDVDANQITNWKAQLLDGAAAVFGSGGAGPEAARVVDLKALHTKIGELALENGFGRRAQQGRHAERKAMIDRSHELSLTRQAAVLKLSRSGLYYRPRPVAPADLEDCAALNQGADARNDSTLRIALERTLEDLKRDLVHNTLTALAWMVADGLLEFKIAIPTGDLDAVMGLRQNPWQGGCPAE